MYDYLSPHGLVMKLNADKVVTFNKSTLTADREFWEKWNKKKHEHFYKCGAFDIEKENTEGYIYDNEIAPERNFV